MKLSKAVRPTLAFFVVGMLICLFVVYGFWKTQQVHSRDLSRLPEIIKISSGVDIALSKFDALLKDDQSIFYEKDVLQPLKNERVKAEAFLALETSDDTRQLLKEVVVGIENLELTTSEVLNRKEKGEVGDSQIRYTELRKRITRQNKKLVAHCTDRAFAQKDETAFLMVVSAISLLAFVVIGSFTVYRLRLKADRQSAEMAKTLETESARVNTLTSFVEAVSAGNYDLHLNTADENDKLTTMLIGMRDKLKENADEDRKRNWATKGEAQIGEILRASTTNAVELFDNIIKFVVKYTRSNQGGLFIYNDDDGQKIIELVASYAFERKKFLTRQLQPGDGLVGQCFLEAETIYLKEVPSHYVSITSGLGGSQPNALLLVPLKVNDKIFGVIELASFHTFEEYEIRLVEKLAESIASTISSVRVNETTRILLEKTQQQAEEMRSQEEEIRQNMEELEATQEEMRRKQMILETELSQSQRQAESLQTRERRLTESEETLQAIVDNIPRAIFWKDKDLRFMGCNRVFASIAGVDSPASLVGKTDFEMPWSAQADAYRRDDAEVMRSRVSKLDIEEVNVGNDGLEYWVRTSKVPIVNKEGEVAAILGMFEDITVQKRREADVAAKVEERDHAIQELEALKRLLTVKTQ